MSVGGERAIHLGLHLEISCQQQFIIARWPYCLLMSTDLHGVSCILYSVIAIEHAQWEVIVKWYKQRYSFKDKDSFLSSCDIILQHCHHFGRNYFCKIYFILNKYTQSSFSVVIQFFDSSGHLYVFSDFTTFGGESTQSQVLCLNLASASD